MKVGFKAFAFFLTMVGFATAETTHEQNLRKVERNLQAVALEGCVDTSNPCTQCVTGYVLDGSGGCKLEQYNCIFNGVEVPPPALPAGTEPNIRYTEEDIHLFYSNDYLNTNSGKGKIEMDFNFNIDDFASLPTTGPRPDYALLITVDADGHCGKYDTTDTHSEYYGKFGDVLYATPNAIYNPANHHISTPTSLQNTAFNPASIKTKPPSNTQKGLLEIITDITKFCAPYYKQESSRCDQDICVGELSFCVEIQAVMCQRKLDFVDVSVLIDFDLTTECDTDDCKEVVLQRARVIDEDERDEKIGKVECRPCKYDAGKNFLTVTQGQKVDTCIDMLTTGVCIRKINQLTFNIRQNQYTTSSYCVIKDDRKDCLFLSGPISYNPTTVSGLDGNDAALSFIPPPEEFQTLEQYGTKEAYFSGEVIIGLGCCCKETLEPGCNCEPTTPKRLQRGLQTDGVANLTFVSDAWSMVEAREEPTGPKCSENFFLSILQTLLGWLWSLLGLGRFCV